MRASLPPLLLQTLIRWMEAGVGPNSQPRGRTLVVPRSRTRPATLDRAPSGPFGAKTAFRLLLANLAGT